MGMDEDGSGTVDKKECLLGAHMLGIKISPHELEMIWPMFGPFDDAEAKESVPVEQFIRTVMVDPHTRCNSATQRVMHEQMMTLQLRCCHRTVIT